MSVQPGEDFAASRQSVKPKVVVHHVAQELGPILNQVLEDAAKHDDPDYEACMEGIKNLSGLLWGLITEPGNAEEGSLDEMIVDD